LAKNSWQNAKEQYGSNKIRIMAGSFRDLTVYKKAFDLAMNTKQKIWLKLLTALCLLPT
jgi:hypothetical protein